MNCMLPHAYGCDHNSNLLSSSELVERNPEPFLPLLGLGISAVSSIFKKRKRDFVEYDEGLDLISRSEPEEL